GMTVRPLRSRGSPKTRFTVRASRACCINSFGSMVGLLLSPCTYWMAYHPATRIRAGAVSGGALSAAARSGPLTPTPAVDEVLGGRTSGLDVPYLAQRVDHGGRHLLDDVGVARVAGPTPGTDHRR